MHQFQKCKKWPLQYIPLPQVAPLVDKGDAGPRPVTHCGGLAAGGPSCVVHSQLLNTIILKFNSSVLLFPHMGPALLGVYWKIYSQ